MAKDVLSCEYPFDSRAGSTSVVLTSTLPVYANIANLSFQP
jgi:hypothetical protein